jgi:hypothetical protein
VLAALVQEVRLDLRPERLEIEAARARRGRRALAQQGRSGGNGDKNARKTDSNSAHGRFIYGLLRVVNMESACGSG